MKEKNMPTMSVGNMAFAYDYKKMIELQSQMGSVKIQNQNLESKGKVKTKKIINRRKTI